LFNYKYSQQAASKHTEITKPKSVQRICFGSFARTVLNFMVKLTYINQYTVVFTPYMTRIENNFSLSQFCLPFHHFSIYS